MGTVRGKTSPNSTPGSFAPGRHDEADASLDPPPPSEAISEYLSATGEGSLEDWASGSGYRQDGDSWTDEDGNEVNLEVAFTNAMEANQQALEADRQHYDDNAGWEGAWETECPGDAGDLRHINNLLDSLD